jgi:hypothetical protein
MPHLVVSARNCRPRATFGPIAITFARLFDGAELIQSDTPPPFFTEPLSLANDRVYAVSHRIVLILCHVSDRTRRRDDYRFASLASPNQKGLSNIRFPKTATW